MNDRILQMFWNYCLVFDIVRIIDVQKKKVILSNRDNDIEKSCFKLLKKNAPCINCIICRTYNERKRFMKIEYFGKKIYGFISVPIEIEKNLFVFEFINDITEENLIEKKTIEMKRKIDEINILTLTDELTGAYNRRYINERLPLEIINKTIQNKNFTITLMDVDFFKKINDTYGHLIGDYILKEIVEIIKNNIRSNDWIARYGGEEFLIVFSHNKYENILKVIERIRKKIEKHDFIVDGNKIKVTVSFGVAKFTKNENVNTLLEKADENLYEAKRSGRNKIID